MVPPVAIEHLRAITDSCGCSGKVARLPDKSDTNVNGLCTTVRKSPFLEVTDIGKTVHPHPTLGESIGMTAELFEGVCTDLPRKRNSDDICGGGHCRLRDVPEDYGAYCRASATDEFK